MDLCGVTLHGISIICLPTIRPIRINLKVKNLLRKQGLIFCFKQVFDQLFLNSFVEYFNWYLYFQWSSFLKCHFGVDFLVLESLQSMHIKFQFGREVAYFISFTELRMSSLSLPQCWGADLTCSYSEYTVTCTHRPVGLSLVI